MKQGDWGQWINWAFAWDIGNRKPKVSNENASRSERRRTKKEVDRRREKGKKEEERRERRKKKRWRDYKILCGSSIEDRKKKQSLSLHSTDGKKRNEDKSSKSRGILSLSLDCAVVKA